MLLIALLECFAFNLPFWATLSASTDTSAAANTLGPGLERTENGLLRVTDPTGAWLEVKSDGTSHYARVDLADETMRLMNSKTLTDDAKPAAVFHLRFDANGTAGRTQAMSLWSPRSLYPRTEASGTIRVWVQEPKGTLVPIDAVRANVRVPFQWSWTRVVVLAAAVLLLLLWRPGSRLWRTPLDPSDRRQRIALAVVLAAVAIPTMSAVVWMVSVFGPMVFHNENGYTYDYDQYAHVADALLHGRIWLDLKVPAELAVADAPHSIVTRSRLMADGVTPIYWDYAYYDGHWYSYFGVVPALLLFVPYQMVTAWMADGDPLGVNGRMLPTGAADLLLMYGFLVFACLMVVRLVHRIAPRASVASTSMAMALFLVCSNACYLWFRTNFYSVPIAASMMFTCLGLWLWMGAIRPQRHTGTGRSPRDGRTLWRIGGSAPLSLPHLAGGALCIALNFGCRPPFSLAALLAIPLFWPQIRALADGLRRRTITLRHALAAPLAVVAPAIIVVLPLMAYNKARFGSLFDFGSAYQMTVTDMTSFRLPAADIPYMIVYYLFLPLRFTGVFPYLAIQPTPLPEWGFTEAMVGGLFITCPLALLAFALPRMRRRVARPYWATLMCALVIGLLLVVVDIVEGGMGWRYMCDFGWLIAIAAMPALLRVVEGRAVFEPWLYDDLDDSPYSRTPIWRHGIRLLVMLVLAAMLAVTVLSCFVPGRDDSLDHNNPGFFYDIRSWFTLLGLN
ncbi:glycosyltransferase [Bifidobacterium sp. SO1]|nr:MULTISPECIES: glycosyltransferase [Bifidobacterium]MBT1160685.1 glycosyltransferase [Bifidobacterium sp. SO1]MBW3077898.1 glycosyltransferase [Bifidobacterium simiiventris]